MRAWVVRCGRPVPVRGQERGQRRQHLLGSLLGEPVAAVGDDHGLHVVRDELHRIRGPFTDALRSADRQHGQGQPPFLALRVLRAIGVPRAVLPEAPAQSVGVGGEDVDVVLFRVLRKRMPALGELEAEIPVFMSSDQLFVQFVEPVEGDVPELVVERPGANRGGEGVTPAMTASPTARRSSRSR